MNSETTLLELVTRFGRFQVRHFETGLALTVGDISSGAPLVRIQSSCVFSESFGSVTCDCALQLHNSMSSISTAGLGAVIYLFDEGRGAGLPAKMRAMALEARFGIDTVEAFSRLGLPPDLRTYDGAISMLQTLQLSRQVRLITNNPAKKERLEQAGYEVVEIVALNLELNEETKSYLRMKRDKLGHAYWDCD